MNPVEYEQKIQELLTRLMRPNGEKVWPREKLSDFLELSSAQLKEAITAVLGISIRQIDPDRIASYVQAIGELEVAISEYALYLLYLTNSNKDEVAKAQSLDLLSQDLGIFIRALLALNDYAKENYDLILIPDPEVNPPEHNEEILGSAFFTKIEKFIKASPSRGRISPDSDWYFAEEQNSYVFYSTSEANAKTTILYNPLAPNRAWITLNDDVTVALTSDALESLTSDNKELYSAIRQLSQALEFYLED